MSEEKIFAQGFLFKRNDKAPDFVIGNLSIKLEEAIPFLEDHEKKGWVNLSIKKSQGGKYYLDLDTFEPKGESTGSKYSKKPQETAPAETLDDDDDDDGLPF